jgi:hypothetical protein
MTAGRFTQLARARHLAEQLERAGSTLPRPALEFAGRDRTVPSVGTDGPQHITSTVRLAQAPRPPDAR